MKKSNTTMFFLLWILTTLLALSSCQQSEKPSVMTIEKTGIVERCTQGKNANGYDIYSFKIKNDPAYYEGDSYYLYQHECELMKSGDSVSISYKDNNFDGAFDRNHDQMIHFKNYSLSKQ